MQSIKQSFNFQSSISCRDARGTWSSILFEAAALARPGVVGWSGILSRNISRWFLKSGKSLAFSFLWWSGSRLNSLAPCAPSDLSLASFTLLGALISTESISGIAPDGTPGSTPWAGTVFPSSSTLPRHCPWSGRWTVSGPPPTCW